VTKTCSFVTVWRGLSLEALAKDMLSCFMAKLRGPLYHNYNEHVCLYVTRQPCCLGAGSHGCPSPKSQLLSLKRLSKYGFISTKVRSWLSYAKTLLGLALRVGSTFLLDLPLNTQVLCLTYGECCHIGIHVILGTHVNQPLSYKAQIAHDSKKHLSSLVGTFLRYFLSIRKVFYT
jgi:hypothetical protein